MKLKRFLSFVKGTLDNLWIIGADSLRDLHVWVNTSHVVHENILEHTGGTVSMGNDTLHSKSFKEKLNTGSTMELRMVAVSKCFPYNLLQVKFFSGQGYDIRNNHIYQNNISTMKMEKNDRNSCNGNSLYIVVKCFLMKDRVDKMEVEIKYCPAT